jgi:ankyrin repeat protein
MLHDTAEADDAPAVQFWLNAGVPIDVRNNKGETALHRAASSGAFGALSVLIEANSAPSFINARARSGATALYLAARNGKRDDPLPHLDVVKELVKHGADRSVRALPEWSFEREQKPRGFTPLDAARSHMILPIVEYLEDFDDQTMSSSSSLPRYSIDESR